MINGGKFKGGIVVKKGSETITEGRTFPISIRGGSFGRGLFTENFALSSSEQTLETLPLPQCSRRGPLCFAPTSGPA